MTIILIFKATVKWKTKWRGSYPLVLNIYGFLNQDKVPFFPAVTSRKSFHFSSNFHASLWFYAGERSKTFTYPNLSAWRRDLYKPGAGRNFYQFIHINIVLIIITFIYFITSSVWDNCFVFS